MKKKPLRDLPLGYTVTPAAQARLADLAGLLSQSREEWRTITETGELWTPATGSHAEWERKHLTDNEFGPAERWGLREAELPRDTAALYTLAASEQCGGLGVLYSAAEVVFPTAPVVRSVIEHTSRAMWLLDNRISPRARVARAWLEVLEGSRQAEQTRARLGGKGTHLRAQDFKRTRAMLQTLFLPEEITDVNGSTVILNEKRPNATEALALASDIAGSNNTAGALDYLANASHPTTYTIRELLTDVTYATGKQASTVSLSDTSYPSTLAAAGVVSLYNVARAFQGYLGWRPDLLNDWYQHMSEVIPDSAPPATLV